MIKKFFKYIIDSFTNKPKIINHALNKALKKSSESPNTQGELLGGKMYAKFQFLDKYDVIITTVGCHSFLWYVYPLNGKQEDLLLTISYFQVQGEQRIIDEFYTECKEYLNETEKV